MPYAALSVLVIDAPRIWITISRSSFASAPQLPCAALEVSSAMLLTVSCVAPTAAAAASPEYWLSCVDAPVTGLTHRQAYKDIFAVTIIKTLAVFVIIGLFYAFGIV